MPPRRSYKGGESQRTYNRWTEDEKQALLACRRENPDMPNADFTKAFYPNHNAGDIGDRVKRYTKKYTQTIQQGVGAEAGTRASSTTTSSSTSATRTTKSPLKCPSKNPRSVLDEDDDADSDDETCSEDKDNGDIKFQEDTEEPPNKRLKLTPSKRPVRDKPQERQASSSGVVQPPTTETQQSQNQTATPMSSSRTLRLHIVPFSEHASRHRDPQTDGLSTNATSPPPPPPSGSPSPQPPPPPPSASLSSGRSEEEQIPKPNEEQAIAATRKSSEQPLSRAQGAANNDGNHDITIRSALDIVFAYIKRGEKENKYFQMMFSRKDECEEENARLKNEVAALQKQCETLEKQCESVQRDKDCRISQLQEEINSGRTERENLANDNMDLRKTLNGIISSAQRHTIQ